MVCDFGSSLLKCLSGIQVSINQLRVSPATYIYQYINHFFSLKQFQRLCAQAVEMLSLSSKVESLRVGFQCIYHALR